jgi:membrane-bound metal-dependent hydrolase YbcI (DUF457 family)
MFVGHYAAAFGARAFKPALPLWLLFVAVQFVDYLWAVLVLIGVERVRIVPGFLAASPLDLYFMPYSHSLLAALFWAIAFGLAVTAWRKGRDGQGGALILAAAVFSHWIADLIVHTQDLPLGFGNHKVGLGLWDYFWPSQIAELGLLALGFWFYLKNTVASAPLGRFTPYVLFGFLVALQAINHLLPVDPTASAKTFAVLALFSYSLVSLAAWGVDVTRTGKNERIS